MLIESAVNSNVLTFFPHLKWPPVSVSMDGRKHDQTSSICDGPHELEPAWIADFGADSRELTWASGQAPATCGIIPTCLNVGISPH